MSNQGADYWVVGGFAGALFLGVLVVGAVILVADGDSGASARDRSYDHAR